MFLELLQYRAVWTTCTMNQDQLILEAGVTIAFLINTANVFLSAAQVSELKNH